MAKVLTVLLCFILQASGVADDWVEAEAAYATGHYEEATRLYEMIHASGFRPAALYYNYANSLFKQGHVHEAIAAYRNAQYLAPRDLDILTNLRYAVETAGGTLPTAPLIERAGTLLSHAEWIRLGWVCYGLCLLLFFMILLFPFTRKRASIGIIISSMGLLFCVAGSQIQSQIVDKNEYVTQAECSIHFAPLDSADVQFHLPKTTLIRGTGRVHNEWIEVVHENRRGWISRNPLIPLFP